MKRAYQPAATLAELGALSKPKQRITLCGGKKGRGGEGRRGGKKGREEKKRKRKREKEKGERGEDL
jgi:hypothetical protein